MSPICVILLVTSVSTVSHQSYPTGKDQICFSLSQVPLIEFTSSVHDLRIVLDPLSLKANTTMVNVMISTRVDFENARCSQQISAYSTSTITTLQSSIDLYLENVNMKHANNKNHKCISRPLSFFLLCAARN